MLDGYQRARLDSLRRTQNPDGGWGYFAGKASWLEPTFYALLALYEDREHKEWQKGWRLLRSWQRPDGAWRPSENVSDAHWSTSLAITLHCLTGNFGDGFQKGVEWLLSISGKESGLLVRLTRMVTTAVVDYDPKFSGWPWRPGASAWIEPTAHTLIALKKAAHRFDRRDLGDRIELAEGLILSRRCYDGGWNHGNTNALGVKLPGYPETTALALIGLQGNPAVAEIGAHELARGLWQGSTSRLSRAWLGLCLRTYGQPVSAEPDDQPVSRDLLLTALEALTHPAGQHALLKVASGSK